MRILGYGFDEEAAAQQALNDLVDRYDLGPDDARVARLSDGLILAVRAREDDLEGVKGLLVDRGGEQLTDVDEGWTRPR